MEKQPMIYIDYVTGDHAELYCSRDCADKQLQEVNPTVTWDDKDNDGALEPFTFRHAEDYFVLSELKCLRCGDVIPMPTPKQDVPVIIMLVDSDEQEDALMEMFTVLAVQALTKAIKDAEGAFPKKAYRSILDGVSEGIRAEIEGG
jgi:hypothetical protein